MHDRARSPSRRRNRRHRKKLSAAELREREDRKREADAKRQREKRARENDGTITFPGRCSPAFIEAMKARAKFFGASKQEADAASSNPKQIAALAFDVLDDFAAHWYERK